MTSAVKPTDHLGVATAARVEGDTIVVSTGGDGEPGVIGELGIGPRDSAA